MSIGMRAPLVSAAREEAREGDAVYVLHHDVEEAVVEDGVERLHYVRVANARGEARFVAERARVLLAVGVHRVRRFTATMRENPSEPTKRPRCTLACPPRATLVEDEVTPDPRRCSRAPPHRGAGPSRSSSIAAVGAEALRLLCVTRSGTIAPEFCLPDAIRRQSIRSHGARILQFSATA